MKFTEYLIFAALLVPTVLVITAAMISLAAPRSATLNTSLVAQYGHLEQQP
jgi:hypothetical protein